MTSSTPVPVEIVACSEGVVPEVALALSEGVAETDAIGSGISTDAVFEIII